MDILRLMAIFIQYPWVAALIGVILIILGQRRRGPIAVAVGGIWLLYAAYETGMRLRWLCSGECNIRIDLLVIYPFLLAMTIIGIISLLRARRPR